MKHAIIILVGSIFLNTAYASSTEADVKTTVRFMNDGSVEVSKIMSQEEYKSSLVLGEEVNNGLTETKGLKRKRYRITCHKRKPDGTQESWVEKAYSSILVTPIAIVGCQAKVGDPSHSLQKL